MGVLIFWPISTWLLPESLPKTPLHLIQRSSLMTSCLTNLLDVFFFSLCFYLFVQFGNVEPCLLFWFPQWEVASSYPKLLQCSVCRSNNTLISSFPFFVGSCKPLPSKSLEGKDFILIAFVIHIRQGLVQNRYLIDIFDVWDFCFKWDLYLICSIKLKHN